MLNMTSGAIAVSDTLYFYVSVTSCFGLSGIGPVSRDLGPESRDMGPLSHNLGPVSRDVDPCFPIAKAYILNKTKAVIIIVPILLLYGSGQYLNAGRHQFYIRHL